RGGECPGRPRGGGRGGRGRLSARHQGTGNLRLRGAGVVGGEGRRNREDSQGAGAALDRGLRRARRGPRRERTSQDAKREDHAAHPAQDRGRRVRRPGRHHDARGSRGGGSPGGGASPAGRLIVPTPLLTALALLAFAANSILCRLALGTASIDAASFTAIRIV